LVDLLFCFVTCFQGTLFPWSVLFHALCVAFRYHFHLFNKQEFLIEETMILIQIQAAVMYIL
jgi:hypothetical protein